jgi:hypothetical protein
MPVPAFSILAAVMRRTLSEDVPGLRGRDNRSDHRGNTGDQEKIIEAHVRRAPCFVANQVWLLITG